MSVAMGQLSTVIDAGQLSIERQQCIDEGVDLGDLAGTFDRLIAMGDGLVKDKAAQKEAGKLLDRTVKMRPGKEFTYREPSDLPRIRKARRRRPKLPMLKLDDDALRERALGAWLGRCAGCLLGKAVEGRRKLEIETYLRSQDRWPLAEYFSNEADDELRRRLNFRPAESDCYIENVERMPEDDDTNYTVAAMKLIERHGLDFGPAEVATNWLENLAYHHTFTAERAAYRNLVGAIAPVDRDGKSAGRFSSATYRNPFREWIGAQIRGDFYGYICPGDPATAAELAWRDAAISHVKNGLYGEMWVAAMLAAAYVVKPVFEELPRVIRAGLGEIPHNSRFHAAVSEVLDWHEQGVVYEDVVGAVHNRWDEANPHHWCHAISNAQLVAIALLWGELDLGRTICRAVMAGFDTDCNGATAGSVVGLMLGGGKLGEDWVGPLNNTLATGVAGYHEVAISDLAAKTITLYAEKVRGA